MKKRFFKWLKILTVAYFIIGIALYFLQERFLFHPASLTRNYQYQFNVPFAEMEIALNEKDTINLVRFFPRDSVRRGIVLYFHGNRDNINRYAKFADNFTKHGYELWMEDYPGFGKSIGNRSEKDLYKQAMAVYNMAAAAYRPDRIILYGKSFGTGIAAYVAANTNCRRLILETPYCNIPALFSCYAPIYPTAWVTKYKIPTDQYLKQIKYPVSIFHGSNDWVIPYRCAAKLKSVLKPADEFVTIENGTHHNLNDFPLFHQKLDSLLLH